MCGIVGVLALRGKLNSDDRRLVQEGLQLTRHRGPDHMSIYNDQSICFGYNRLAIRNVSDEGNQPIRCGNIVAFGNGEVYYPPAPDDQSDLLPLAEKIISSSIWDFGEFDADFAIAVWDPNTQTLKLARDGAGVKPLFYTLVNDRRLAFASEQKALIGFLEKRELCPRTAVDYLYFGYPTGDRTFFKDISRLRHRKMLVSHGGNITLNSGPSQPTKSTGSFREVLQQSVRRRRKADVKIGYHLSGGLDSSLVVSMAHTQSEEAIRTFSAYYKEDDFDKLGARRLAKRLNSEHVSVFVKRSITPRSLIGTLDGPPMSLGSLVPLNIANAARGHGLKVLLAGQGADELFAGYARFKKIKYNMSKGDLAQLVSNVTDFTWDTFIKTPKLGHVATTEFMAKEFPSILDPWEAVLGWYFQTFLQELLRIEDHCHMYASVENRVPFLGSTVIDWSKSQRPTFLGATQMPKQPIRQCHSEIGTGVDLNTNKHNSNGSVEAYLRHHQSAIMSDLDFGVHCVTGIDIGRVRNAIALIAASNKADNSGAFLLRVAFLCSFARIHGSSINLNEALG